MRTQQWLATAALVMAPAVAFAQTTGSTTDQTTTDQTTTTTTTTTTQRTTSDVDYDSWDSVRDQWVASGFVGSNFGEMVEESGVDFGGSVGYLWNSAIGAEFMAGFTPDFQIANALLADEPQVNSYMANAIAAAPLGDEHQWQPFISGGLGAITIRSDVFSNADALDAPDEARFGGNIGGGIMGFVGNWGIRGDVRYFRAFEDDPFTNDTAPDQNPAAVAALRGLDFWRANIGLAVRW